MSRKKPECQICRESPVDDLAIYIPTLGHIYLCVQCLKVLPGAITAALTERADL